MTSSCFSVDVTDVYELELEVDPNGNFNCDLSTWASAKVFKPEGTKNSSLGFITSHVHKMYSVINW